MSTGQRTRRAVLIFALSTAVPASTSAQSLSDTVRFLAGGAAGLAIHESGHAALDLAFGVPPGVKKVTFGPLPFFAISHARVSPGREFAISSAGFWMQHASSEFILHRRPYLRQEHAPFLKGILAFNVLASAAYATAAFARVGPAERDTLGMAVSAQVAEPLIGATILAPALLDAARYYRPENRWLQWSSRVAKIGSALMIVRAFE